MTNIGHMQKFAKLFLEITFIIVEHTVNNWVINVAISSNNLYTLQSMRGYGVFKLVKLLSYMEPILVIMIMMMNQFPSIFQNRPRQLDYLRSRRTEMEVKLFSRPEMVNFFC